MVDELVQGRRTAGGDERGEGAQPDHAAGGSDGLDDLVREVAGMVADGTGVGVGSDDRPRAAADRIQAGADPGVGDVDGDPVLVHRADQSPAEPAEPPSSGSQHPSPATPR
jgi:hypothetical protein